ncbi:MAG: hypothetical protein HJJLKODD_02021 [Phycisphaerae bacterium]|nr:hypothetical protein [Phycisphaerae bacterium]
MKTSMLIAGITGMMSMMMTETAKADYQSKKIWVPAECRLIERTVVIPAEYELVTRRVWLEPIYEYRTRKVFVAEPANKFYLNLGDDDFRLGINVGGGCGTYRTITEKVCIREGHWKTCTEKVCVRQERVQVIKERVCVREGYWKNVYVCHKEPSIKVFVSVR